MSKNLINNMVQTLTGEKFWVYASGGDLTLADCLSPQNPKLLKELLYFAICNADPDPLLFLLGEIDYARAPTMDKMNYLFTNFVRQDQSTPMQLNINTSTALAVENGIKQFMKDRADRSGKGKDMLGHLESMKAPPPSNLFTQVKSHVAYTIQDNYVTRYKSSYVHKTRLGLQASRLPQSAYAAGITRAREAIQDMRVLGFTLPGAILSA